MQHLQAFIAEFDALLARRRAAMTTPDVRATVAEIIARVRADGDAALCALTERFDGCALTPTQLRVAPAEAAPPSEPALQRAIAQASANIRFFHEQQLRPAWSALNPDGGRVGEMFRPVERAGVYVPGGTAPLISTVLMTVIPAQVAGVTHICVATPPDRNGQINPGILAACHACGITEIYRVGGAQAIAALAFGTATIPRVDVIAGPGNKYVTEAKRQVFGHVGVDLLAGPSESMIIIDNTANPAWVAADILSQAEHLDSATYIVSVPEMIMDRVEAHIYALLSERGASSALKKAVADRMVCIHVQSLDAAADVANLIAPEHLQIITEDNPRVLARLRNAGAVFLGPHAPVPLGDFVAGPSHVLPTGCAARFSSGLSTDVFRKRISVMECDAAAFARMADAIVAFGTAEQLPAHAHTATIRRA
ncbi:MAG: histidinol dehydrogenase [bacterium]|nr:histidinol dehydrogenase [bacterium]